MRAREEDDVCVALTCFCCRCLLIVQQPLCFSSFESYPSSCLRFRDESRKKLRSGSFLFRGFLKNNRRFSADRVFVPRNELAQIKSSVKNRNFF